MLVLAQVQVLLGQSAVLVPLRLCGNGPRFVNGRSGINRRGHIPCQTLCSMQRVDLLTELSTRLIAVRDGFFRCGMSVPDLGLSRLGLGERFGLLTLEFFVADLAKDVGTMGRKGTNRVGDISSCHASSRSANDMEHSAIFWLTAR